MRLFPIEEACRVSGFVEVNGGEGDAKVGLRYSAGRLAQRWLRSEMMTRERARRLRRKLSISSVRR